MLDYDPHADFDQFTNCSKEEALTHILSVPFFVSPKKRWWNIRFILGANHCFCKKSKLKFLSVFSFFETWEYQQNICPHILLYFASTLICDLLGILMIIKDVFRSIEQYNTKGTGSSISVKPPISNLSSFVFVNCIIYSG